jgi:dUTP pyrophosphatase
MKWTQLTETAVIPTRGTEYSAGYDFYADATVSIEPNGVAIIPTGISFVDMNNDEYLQLSLRSSTSLTRPVVLANGVGIVDSDYAGKEIGIIIRNMMPNMRLTVDKGTKLAQGILLKYLTVDNEEAITTKRTGGYGTTN